MNMLNFYFLKTKLTGTLYNVTIIINWYCRKRPGIGKSDIILKSFNSINLNHWEKYFHNTIINGKNKFYFYMVQI